MNSKITVSSSATFNRVEVSFRDFPCLLKSGKRRYVDKNFGWDFIKALYSGKAFPVAQSGVFSFSKLKCMNCKSVLPKENSGNKKFEGTINIGSESFQITVISPAIKCDNCGLLQLQANADISNEVSEAFAMAIENAGVKP